MTILSRVVLYASESCFNTSINVFLKILRICIALTVNIVAQWLRASLGHREGGDQVQVPVGTKLCTYQKKKKTHC